MKKVKEVRLPKTTPASVAKGMSKNLGKDRALAVVVGTVKNLSSASLADLNSDVFNSKEVKSRVNFWVQVQSLLSK